MTRCKYIDRWINVDTSRLHDRAPHAQNCAMPRLGVAVCRFAMVARTDERLAAPAAPKRAFCSQLLQVER